MFQDAENTSLPKPRTALVYEELARFNADVGAVIETRLPESINISEVGTECTIFWRDKALEESHVHGVNFSIRSQLVQQYNLTPKVMAERLIIVRIPFTRDTNLH